MSKAAMQQALEALDEFSEISDFTPALAVHAMKALRAALSEPEQQPVASLMTNIQSGEQKVVWNDDGFDRAIWHETPLYTAPTPRKPLTEEQIEGIDCIPNVPGILFGDVVKFARAIERKHGITGETK